MHNFDAVESGPMQRNFHNATPICILFKKTFIPAWTLEEMESVLLNFKFREMLETQEYKRAQDAEERRQREVSRLIWTPLKLVPYGTNFSEKFVPTIGQPHERKSVTTTDVSGVLSCISRKMNDCFS